MRWVLGTGVGLVALSNSTYAPMAPTTATVLDELADAGAVSGPSAEATPRLLELGQRLVGWVNGTDDGSGLFADNVDLDEPLSERAAALAELRAAHGQVRLAHVFAERDVGGRDRPRRGHRAARRLPSGPDRFSAGAGLRLDRDRLTLPVEPLSRTASPARCATPPSAPSTSRCGAGLGVDERLRVLEPRQHAVERRRQVGVGHLDASVADDDGDHRLAEVGVRHADDGRSRRRRRARRAQPRSPSGRCCSRR